MMSLGGQAGWAKMMPSGVKLPAPACHPTKKVKKAEELTYPSTNIVTNDRQKSDKQVC